MALDMIFGSSVFLYFNAGRLRMVVAQVIKSHIQSQGFTEDFRAAATRRLGDPISDILVNVPLLPSAPGNPYKQFHRTTCWNESDQVLRSELAPSGSTAFVLWSLR